MRKDEKTKKEVPLQKRKEKIQRPIKNKEKKKTKKDSFAFLNPHKTAREKRKERKKERKKEHGFVDTTHVLYGRCY